MSRATAKEISMDATVAAVIAKLDSIFFFLSTSEILTELPGARRVASTLATPAADTDWSILT